MRPIKRHVDKYVSTNNMRPRDPLIRDVRSGYNRTAAKDLELPSPSTYLSSVVLNWRRARKKPLKFDRRRFEMAGSYTKSEEINVERVAEEKKLKYLNFVHVAAIQAALCLSSLYEFAKENSGPLKPAVQSAEGTVKAVIGPVYERLHGVPFDLLKFVDRKVDDALEEIDRHVPSTLRSAAQKVPEVTRSVVGEVQRSGVAATASGMAKAAYARYEPVAEQYAAAGWRSLNRLPVFPQVAQIVVPTAAYWAEKYNKTVACAASRGYEVAQYMPLVPTERIARVFGEESGQKAAAAARGKADVDAVPAE